MREEVFLNGTMTLNGAATINGTLRSGGAGGANTLRKQKERTLDSKMEQLRKKLKTDDDLAWVDTSKTLDEQDISPEETLIFRRKFFFSDQNIDSRDPVQLHLLYVQSRDAIIDGTHPVTLDMACQFAGIQCQIEFHNHVESKHKPGFLMLKDYLPRDYIKVKNVEKKIFAEHRARRDVSNVDAKVEYVSKARALKTYGVTFFLVKEKMQGKNKLVPRLLGVTKESVLRLDEKTKEILKTWPLTTVKRWAPTPNSFTLDFGDYSDSYYSVQTTEGEQIAKLIAGYIDIILRRKKAKDHFGIEGDEGSAMIEESVSPSKATILQHQPDAKPSKPIIEDVSIPGIIRSVAAAAQTLDVKQVPQEKQLPAVKSAAPPPLVQSPFLAAQQPKFLQTGVGGPQQALLGTIGTGQDAVQRALKELDSNVPKSSEYGPDFGYRQGQFDVKKETVSSQMAALNAATAQVLTLTSLPEEEVDHPALGAAINTITTNLPEMSKDVREIASMMDDKERGGRLIDAARNLCHAFSDLLRAAEPAKGAPRTDVLSAASKVSDATSNVLYTIEEEDGSGQLIDREASDRLLSLSKLIAKATAALILKTKDVASRCTEQNEKNRVIGAATQCALATSQLVSCAKVVAPTIHSTNCQKQVLEAGRDVSKTVDGILKVCSEVADPHLNKEVERAADQVNLALNDLANHVRSLGEGQFKRQRSQENGAPGGGAVDTILDATDRLFNSTGDASEMVKQAKILAQATSQLIQNIKGQAETQPDSGVQKRLLAAAKTLADATSRLVEAAKGCASNPYDSGSQAALRQAAEDLRSATNTAASNALKKKVMSRLEASAKQATATASQTIAAAHGASHSNANATSNEELLTTGREVSELIPAMASGIRQLQQEPNSATKQSALVAACENFITPAFRLVSAAKSAAPTVTDRSSAIQLGQASQQLAESLSELRAALSKASEACSFTMEIDVAIENVRQMNAELSECRMAALKHNLRPLPGDEFEKCAGQISQMSKQVASSMAQLLAATSHKEENLIGPAAREVTNALKSLTSASRGIAATSGERDVQMRSLDNSIEILEHSVTLFEEIRWAMHNGDDADRSERLMNIAKSLSVALQNCVNSLPSHREVDESIRTIEESTRALSLADNLAAPYSSSRTYAELQEGIASAATRLNESTSEVIESSSRNPSQLGSSSRLYSTNYATLFGLGQEIAGQTNDAEVQTAIVSCLSNLALSSSKFLGAAKVVSTEPNAPNARSNLASGARAVTEAIGNLLDVCSSSAPGQKECDSAIQNIQMMRTLLENPYEPFNDATYFECLEMVTERSRRLGDAMTGIANHARRSEHEQFGRSVKEASESICGLLEGAAQAAYLVGASDPSSVPGKAGVIDLNLLQRSNETIQSACRQLVQPQTAADGDLKSVLKAATEIAKATSSLCNACRIASSKTTSPAARSNFVKSAKDIANVTAALIKEIKSLEDVNAQHVNENVRRTTAPLIEAVEQLITFASSPEFAPVPARISSKARTNQEPIISYGHSIIDASSSMIVSAKSLALNPKDPPGWQTLANYSKTVSDSIKRLVTSIKDASPGQNECDEAIERLSVCIKELDQASFDAINKVLAVREDNNLKGYRDGLFASASEIEQHINGVRGPGKSNAEKLGHALSQMIGYFEPLVANSVGCASKIADPKRQHQLLDKAKDVCEHALQLIYSVKECGGNPKATSIHAEIDDSSQAMRSAISELLQLLEAGASEDGHVNAIIESITKSMTRIDERQYYGATNGASPDTLTYVDYQTRMVAITKEIAKIAQDMVSSLEHILKFGL